MIQSERAALAAIVTSRRHDLGLSARELARRAGVDSGTVVLLEQCKIAHPRVETVQALAAVLQVPLADIYAATNWLPESALPNLRPYMRAKFGELTDQELLQVERLVNELSGHGQIGPRPGEDE